MTNRHSYDLPGFRAQLSTLVNQQFLSPAQQETAIKLLESPEGAKIAQNLLRWFDANPSPKNQALLVLGFTSREDAPAVEPASP